MSHIFTTTSKYSAVLIKIMCLFSNKTSFTVLILISLFNVAHFDKAKRSKIDPGTFLFPNEEILERYNRDENHRNFHHIHQHNHGGHHHGKFNADCDDFHHLGPQESQPTTTEPPDNTTSYGNASMKFIPLDFVRDLEAFSVNDLLLNYVDGYDSPRVILEVRTGGVDEERNAAIKPKKAECKPELQTVKIVENTDATVMYIPDCTRIERCGGCCSHNLLSCQPTDIDTVSMQVIKTQYIGGSKLKFAGKEIVAVERHNKCMCDCRIKSEDCKIFQEYRPTECRCFCKNLDEEKKCYKENNLKLWDPDLCQCLCRDVTQCTTGFQFDHNKCKCVERFSYRRRFANSERKNQESQSKEDNP